MSFDLRRQKQPIFGQGTDFLIGELLLKAGIIKQNQLDDALKLAGNKHMQIGQMLIMAHYITPKQLQAALDAQTAIKDHSMDMNGALRVLNFAYRNGMTFVEASQHQSQNSGVIPTHKLGQLLLEANIISAEQFSGALQKSMAIGLPLGRILISNNVITEAILTAALETLIKLRDGNIAREEAIAHLADISRKKEVNELGIGVLEEATLFRSQFEAITQRGIRLGEFFVLAGILSETDVVNALEFSLVNEKSLGEMLLEHGYVTRDLVEAALKLQALIQNESMDCARGARCLSYMHTNSVNLNDAIEAVNNEAADGSRVDFQTLLFESNIITSEGIQSALELAVNNPRILSRILTQTGYLSDVQAEIMVDCHETIVQNMISLEDAKFVLDYCLQKLTEGPMTFTQALKELGWTQQTNEGYDPNLASEGQNVEQNNVQQPPPANTSTSQQTNNRLPNVRDSRNSMLVSNASDKPFIANTPVNSSMPSAPPPGFPIPAQTQSATFPADLSHSQTVSTSNPAASNSTAPAQSIAAQAVTAKLEPLPKAPPSIQLTQPQSGLPQGTIAKPQPTLSRLNPPAQATPQQALPPPAVPVKPQPLPNLNPPIQPAQSQTLAAQATTNKLEPLPKPTPPTSSQSTQQQASPPQPKARRTGRTTSNMPAIEPLPAGSELMQKPDEQTDSTPSEVISWQNKAIPADTPLSNQIKASSGRAADKSLSLRALLKEEEELEASLQAEPAQENNMQSVDTTEITATEAEVIESISDEGLELSDSEKVLIMKASSLSASPEEIMAAMKLAAKKDKSIQSYDQEQ